MKLNLNNTVIEVLDEKHGEKCKDLFIRNGIKAHDYVFNFTKKCGDRLRYYGVINNEFKNYIAEQLLPTTRIATLEELELEEKGEAREIDYYLVKKECWGVDGTMWTRANRLAIDNSISLPYFREIGLLSNPDYFTPVYKEVKPKFKVGDYCKKVWEDGSVDYFVVSKVDDKRLWDSEYYKITKSGIQILKEMDGACAYEFGDNRCTISVIPKSEFDEVKQRYLAAEKIMIGGYEVKFHRIGVTAFDGSKTLIPHTSIDGNKYDLYFWESALVIAKHSKASVVVGCNAKGLGTHKWEVTQEQIEKIISKLN